MEARLVIGICRYDSVPSLEGRGEMALGSMEEGAGASEEEGRAERQKSADYETAPDIWRMAEEVRALWGKAKPDYEQLR